MDEWEANAIETGQALTSDVIDFLRTPGRLWHRGSVDALEGIVSVGAILPNNGQFPRAYGVSKEKPGWGERLEAVHLFDLANPPLHDVFRTADRWSQFLTDCGPATIWLEIEAGRLDGACLVRGADLPGGSMSSVPDPIDGEPYVPRHIPRVEVWHRGPLPVTAVVQAHAIRFGDRPREVQPVGLGAQGVGKARRLAALWRAEHERQAEESRKQLDLGPAPPRFGW